MTFSQLLNTYMEKLNCSNNELAESSGLSPAVISRYRNGAREPQTDSAQLKQLSAGISALAAEKHISNVQGNQVFAAFSEILNARSLEYTNFITNFNALFETMHINMKRLASSLNFEVSFIYRVKSGERKVTDLQTFCEKIANYMTLHYREAAEKEKLAVLMGIPPERIMTEKEYFYSIASWLLSGPVSRAENTELFRAGSFLRKIDDFDLNDYIRAIHFDELKVPTVPFQFPMNKTYYGIKQMREGELDFFKSTVLSKSMKPIFMHSDMILTDMAEDLEFNKKWMFGIAMSIKKGLHINIIHCLERSFAELMLGLEAWIPIYMTGQITPYHLPNNTGKVYHHLNYVSGTVALCGECIEGFHGDGKYELTNNSETVAYYQRKAEHILSKAEPLMDIFDTARAEEYASFQKKDAALSGKRHNILTSLPLYTIEEELLDKILQDSDISAIERDSILIYRKREHDNMEQKLTNCSIIDEIMIPSKEEFERHPMHLSLSGCFFKEPIPYSFEDMQLHLAQTEEYMKNHTGYSLKVTGITAFRNIQIQILENHHVVISKSKAPVINFVIKHPVLVNALQNFNIAVIE